MNKTYSVKNILNQYFRKRPAMYTGEYSLKSIFCYLEGYRSALREYEIKEEFKNFHDFHDFVAHKFSFRESTAGWENIIVAISLGYDAKQKDWSWDELLERKKSMTHEEHHKSISMFYELVDDFFEEKK